ncbi:MAG TPA: hypothetical protein VN703_10115 [Candidatus Sulfopaludibacter sp.]|nr:hypothetical protein [Candidatus Sulfopaludibacter sp.]
MGFKYNIIFMDMDTIGEMDGSETFNDSLYIAESLFEANPIIQQIEIWDLDEERCVHIIQE